jgi:flagellar protein FliO/FliZ
MFETLFGAEIPAALKFFLAFVIVLCLIGATAWLVRRFGAERFGRSSARGRQPRLAVVDAAAVDGRRRLVIIRRDNVEHLLMIGGPTDVVVESNIVRAMGAPRDKSVEPLAARATSAAETLTRPAPLGEGSLWPLQPQPEINHQRQPRTTLTEEATLQWTAWQTQTEPPPSPSPETLGGLAGELSARPAPQRDTAFSAPPRDSAFSPAAKAATPIQQRTAAPPPGRSPAETAPAAEGTDKNLAEMANRLEAALRRPIEAPAAAETPMKTENGANRPAARKPLAAEPKAGSARAPTKTDEQKAAYDELEQEMASLLGRPQGKP